MNCRWLLLLCFAITATCVSNSSAQNLDIPSTPGQLIAPPAPGSVDPIPEPSEQTQENSNPTLMSVSLQGVLNPIESLRLATRDPGIVDKLLVTEGDIVSEGDTVVVLDQKVYAAELSAARSELAVAKEETQNEVDLKYAEISYELNQKVYQRSQKARMQFAKSVSKTELERLRLESERSRLSQIQAKKQKSINELAESVQKDRLEIAAIRLENRTIKSKIDGMVVQVYNKPGEFVNAGQPLVRILNLDRLRVVCSGNLNKISPADVPNEAVFKIEVNGEEVAIPAKVTFVSPEIDPVRKAYSIWAEIQNVDRKLTSGSVGRLEFSPKN